MSFLAIIAFFVNGLRTDGQTDQRTDGPTDQRTDKASYRDAWTHLKRAKRCIGARLNAYRRVFVFECVHRCVYVGNFT